MCWCYWSLCVGVTDHHVLVLLITVLVNECWCYWSLCVDVTDQRVLVLLINVCWLSGKLQMHKWENAMTMDRKSWGYRREATIADYLTIKELISDFVITVRYSMLCDDCCISILMVAAAVGVTGWSMLVLVMMEGLVGSFKRGFPKWVSELVTRKSSPVTTWWEFLL